ncbi:phospholipase D-like domain-containing protein [Cuniculiplasma sp. SKW4]|uniref:phospholipase D-like domain-containing protein n=1 Tax=Cuniculiplasma sp. SKW4 TaxID=3400171 RepID=UPI003FD3FBF4
MLGMNNVKGKKMEKVIDNRSRVIGPVLMRTASENSKPVISGKENIFQSGDQNLHDRILEIISSTRDILCISSFIIQDSDIFSEIEKCTHRGARVYILTSGEQQLPDPYDDDFSRKERKDAGIELIKRLGKRALLKSGENLHSKFIISDPKTNPRAMMFTFNLTVRAMNENLEIAIELSRSAAIELYHQFIKGFWVVSKRILTLSSGNSSSLNAAKEHPEFAGTMSIPNEIKWTINNETLIREELRNLIISANSSISISSWTFEASHVIAEELIKKAKSGIDVTVFTRPHEVNAPFLREIIENGAKVYCHRLLHGKSVVIDGSRGMIMTANVSKLGMDEGFETAVILKEDQVEILKQIHNEWKNRAEYESINRIKLGDVKNDYLEISSKLEKKNPPASSEEINGGEIRVNIEDYLKGEFEIDQEITKKDALELRYTVTLIPPRLPEGSVKVVSRPEQRLDVYKYKNENYVCIRTEEDLDEAKRIAKDIKANIVIGNN